MKENKNGGGKGGKYLGKENISFVEEGGNEEGKCYHSGTSERTRKERTTQPMDHGRLR